jgi:4a-hydroxytetrahydrobiopterin dehydratase
MNADTLRHKKCVPCEGTEKPFTWDQINHYMTFLNEPWGVIEDRTITKEFKLASFMKSIEFVQEIAKIAEEEGHHPDIYIFYKTVKIELSTHAIKGLSEKDFILARKIEDLYSTISN